MNRADRAVSIHKAGFNCAQSVFSVFAPELGLEMGAAARTATAFGGGIARSGATCGAVTGALMAIGLRYGNGGPEDKEAKDRTYGIAREFMRRFEKSRGALACRELLGCDIGTPEGYAKARGQGLFDSVCVELVRDAVLILEEMLSE